MTLWGLWRIYVLVNKVIICSSDDLAPVKRQALFEGTWIGALFRLNHRNIFSAIFNQTSIIFMRQASLCFLTMSRDHSVHAASQWDTALQCNTVSHWLDSHLEWSLQWTACGCRDRYARCSTWPASYRLASYMQICSAMSACLNNYTTRNILGSNCIHMPIYIPTQYVVLCTIWMHQPKAKLDSVSTLMLFIISGGR